MIYKINVNKFINHANTIKNKIVKKSFNGTSIGKLYFSLYKDFRSMIGEYINAYKNELSKKELTRVRALWERLGHPNFENKKFIKAYYTLINKIIKEDFSSVCYCLFCMYASNNNFFYEYKGKKCYYDGSYEPTIVFNSKYSNKIKAVEEYNSSNKKDKINLSTVYLYSKKFIFDNCIVECNTEINFK